MITRKSIKDYVSHVVDDSGAGRTLNADAHSIIRERGDNHDGETYEYASVLVGWQCGFEPMYVAVHSYLDYRLDAQDAIEMAMDYLSEIGWFAGPPTEPDYVIR